MTRAQRREWLAAGIARLEHGTAAERWCADVLRAWHRSIPAPAATGEATGASGDLGATTLAAAGPAPLWGHCEARAGRLLDRPCDTEAPDGA